VGTLLNHGHPRLGSGDPIDHMGTLELRRTKWGPDHNTGTLEDGETEYRHGWYVEWGPERAPDLQNGHPNGHPIGGRDSTELI